MVLSACLYYKSGEIYFQWSIVTLLALYFVVIHIRSYPVVDVILGELFRLNLKVYCFLLTSLVIVGQ